MAFQPFDLTGQVALVTGGNGGIGLGMAEGLALAGASIAIWGTNPDKNEKAGEQLTAMGADVLTQIVDVSDETRVDEAMAEVLEKFGRLDTCIANAGMSQYAGRVHELDTDIYRKVMAVNMDGLMFTIRAATRHMIERAEKGDPGGSLVGVASTAALMGAARNLHYAATKGGVVAYMKGVAVEMARYGVRANSLLPGWIVSEMASPALETEGFKTRVLPRVPMRRWGEKEDFAGIAVYLSSEASRYHTGQEIVICGGYTIF